MDRVKEKVALLPDQPGCYLMKNEKGEVLYVGKAKNLRRSGALLLYRQP